MAAMDNSNLSPQLAMKRARLDDLPPPALPPGCHIRTYQPGDARAWDRIIAEAFGWEDRQGHFERLMLPDPEFRPYQVLFLCEGDEPVATSSAWHTPRYGEDSGTLHWVAVLPRAAGRGLGYHVSLACLHQMADERRRFAALLTDDFRIPAIKTYLKLNFAPLIMHENHRQRWRDIFVHIGKPNDIERFDAELGAAVFEPAPPR